MSPLELLVLAAIAALMLYLLTLLSISVVQPLRRLLTGLRVGLASPFGAKLDDLDRDTRLRRLEEELRRALGQSDPFGSQERADIVSAALAAQELTILNQNLRKTVAHCLQTHWAVAAGLGAIHMSEVARHPWPNRLRQRVIDLSDLLSQRLESYPLILDAPDLIKLQLGIRWIAPTCATCPYWTSTVADAPRICPTARAMGQHRNPVGRVPAIDDDVIDACVEERP